MKLSLALTFLTAFSHADERAIREELCKVPAPAPVETRSLGAVPQYFFRNLPERGQIFFGDRDEQGFARSWRFDTKTGKKDRVPTSVDVVPTPDGKWVVTIGSTPSGHAGQSMDFRRAKGIAETSPPEIVDSELDGAYQSAAVVETRNGSTRYRLFVESHDADGDPVFLTRDYWDPPLKPATADELKAMIARYYPSSIKALEYRVSYSDPKGADKKDKVAYKKLVDKHKAEKQSLTDAKAIFEAIQRATTREEIEKLVEGKDDLYLSPARLRAADHFVDKSAPRPLCANYPKNALKTPMLSKDGSKIGVFNVKTQTTQILYVDAKTGDCKETLNGDPKTRIDLGRPTGKVDFSYDGKKIAFHSQGTSDTDDNRWISVPSGGTVANSYVVDLDKREIQALTHSGSESFLYPAFYADGTVSVVRHVKGPYGAKDAELLIFDPARSAKKASLAELAAIPATGSCAKGPPARRGYLGIGAFLGQLCLEDYGYLARPDLVLLAMTASESQCKAITGLWQELSEGKAKNPAAKKAALRVAKGYPSLFNEVSVQDIQAACAGALPDGAAKREELKQPEHGFARVDWKLVRSSMSERCEECHKKGSANGEFPIFKAKDFAKALARKSHSDSNQLLLDEMIDRVSRDQVPPPPGVPFSGKDKAAVLKYLRCAGGLDKDAVCAEISRQIK